MSTLVEVSSNGHSGVRRVRQDDGLVGPTIGGADDPGTTSLPYRSALRHTLRETKCPPHSGGDHSQIPDRRVSCRQGGRNWSGGRHRTGGRRRRCPTAAWGREDENEHGESGSSEHNCTTRGNANRIQALGRLLAASLLAAGGPGAGSPPGGTGPPLGSRVGPRRQPSILRPLYARGRPAGGAAPLSCRSPQAGAGISGHA